MIKPLATLVALAGLATAAAAQSSSVTLYGLLDLSVQHLRSGDRAPLRGGNLTRLADGTLYGPGSRWGIRVSEDLGSGLNANVVLESGFFADTGTLAQGGRAFGRQAYIALVSKTAGELRLGRQYALHDETMGATNPAGNATPLNPGGVYTLATGTLPLFIDAPRVDNAIQYRSPLLGGFRLQAMLSLGEGTQDRYHGVSGSYTAGPFNAAAVYEQSKAATVPPGGDSTVNKLLELGANYNFGPVTVYGGYQQGKDLTSGPQSQIQIGTLRLPGLSGTATELKAYTLGALVPVGAADLMANYTRSRFSNAAGADVTIGRIGVGAKYALSKRTALYGAIAFATGDLKDDVNEKQIYQLGLRTAF